VVWSNDGGVVATNTIRFGFFCNTHSWIKTWIGYAIWYEFYTQTGTHTARVRIGGPKPGTCVVDDELVVVGGVLIPGVRFEVSVQVAYSSVFVLHSEISALLA